MDSGLLGINVTILAKGATKGAKCAFWPPSWPPMDDGRGRDGKLIAHDIPQVKMADGLTVTGRLRRRGGGKQVAFEMRQCVIR
jgi:hypothetical protein